jgi:hypothetical protein
MTLADHLLLRLKAEQGRYALESLQRPGEKTVFEYGVRVGHVAGLEFAINLLLSALDEERNGERDPL